MSGGYVDRRDDSDGSHHSRTGLHAGTAMSTGNLVLLIVAAAAVLVVVLLAWNNRQRERNQAPPRQRRDLDERIDQVVSGARDVSDRAVRLAGSTDGAAVAAGWSAIQTDMLAVEGDIVNLDVHVGDAPIGSSLADLDRAVHALRDTVEHHVELRGSNPPDEHAIALSHEAIGERRRDVDVALGEVDATRP